MWRKPFGTGVAPTHKGRMSRKYIFRCFQQRWSWKNWSRKLQSDFMAKVWETNQEGITKMSQHRGKKCNDKIASPWRYRGQNGQQQYLLALVIRLGKTFSVHIRRPAASSYWKSNWSDTCIFELNEPGFSSPSLWSRRDAISNLTYVRLKIFNSASFNVLFELDEPGFLSPLILRRADPADTQSRIWCTSGTDSGSEKGSTSAGRKRQVHRWSKSLGYRVTPHLKAVLSQTIIVTCCFI